DYKGWKELAKSDPIRAKRMEVVKAAIDKASSGKMNWDALPVLKPVVAGPPSGNTNFLTTFLRNRQQIAAQQARQKLRDAAPVMEGGLADAGVRTMLKGLTQGKLYSNPAGTGFFQTQLNSTTGQLDVLYFSSINPPVFVGAKPVDEVTAADI